MAVLFDPAQHLMLADDEEAAMDLLELLWEPMYLIDGTVPDDWTDVN